MAPSASWSFNPCPPETADALADALGLHRVTAETLVRRGYDTPEAAAAFLDEEVGHDPLLLGDMAAACDRIARAAEAGERVCVHGDYDADGICATALAVLALRSAGIEVGMAPAKPLRRGYGLAAETVERLAADGVQLLITVDCGITAADQVERARELGMDVIVTDHHQPADRLPDCPRVCTRPSSYPFPELCGTGVVFKLARGAASAAGPRPSRARRAPGPGRPGHDRRRRAARGREPLARPGGAAPARPHRQARPAGADADGSRRPAERDRIRCRLPAGAPDQCRRPPLPSRPRRSSCC